MIRRSMLPFRRWENFVVKFSRCVCVQLTYLRQKMFSNHLMSCFGKSYFYHAFITFSIILLCLMGIVLCFKLLVYFKWIPYHIVLLLSLFVHIFGRKSTLIDKLCVITFPWIRISVQCINRKWPYHTEVSQLIWLTSRLIGWININ